MWCASILYSEVTEIIQELITLKDSGVRLLEYQLDKNDRWLQIGRELHFLGLLSPCEGISHGRNNLSLPLTHFFWAVEACYPVRVLEKKKKKRKKWVLNNSISRLLVFCFCFLVSDSQVCLATEKLLSGWLSCHEVYLSSQDLPLQGKPMYMGWEKESV